MYLDISFQNEKNFAMRFLQNYAADDLYACGDSITYLNIYFYSYLRLRLAAYERCPSAP